MEVFLASISSLESAIIEDVELLSATASDQIMQETLDRIRMNLSSHLTEIRTLIIDKARLHQITLNVENQFHMVNGHILVVIHGVVRNPSTSIATGACSVVWNEEHKLNLSYKNILSIKTAQSSHFWL